MKKIIITCISIIVPIVFTIIWEMTNTDYKQLTIEERKNVPINEFYGNCFTVYYLDSIKVDDRFSVTEYRITNTGNTTILGYGEQSDILTEQNKLPITNENLSDWKFIQLIPNNIADLDVHNRLIFKQWKPKEYIDLICLSTNDSIIDVSDRDIKDVTILYKKADDRITEFEELSMKTKWIQAICCMVYLVVLLIYLFFDLKRRIKDESTTSIKVLLAINYIIWSISLFYIFSLPLRWLL